MNLRSAQFRTLLRNPPLYVAATKQPAREQEGGSPQRPVFEACARAYFRAGADPESAYGELARRLSKSTSGQRYANASAVRVMLMRFMAWHEGEAAPEFFFPQPTIAKIGNHSIWLSPSLCYRLGDGYNVRHVWTETDFSLRRPYTRLAAAGYMIHAEARLGVGSVRQVEFWHVRSGTSAAWQGRDLRMFIPQVITVLDVVERELDGPGDPGQAA